MANLITQEYAINMTPGAIPAVVHVSQYDAGNRNLRFLLYSGNAKFIIPSSATVSIRGSKTDGTVYEYRLNTSDNTAEGPVQVQMTAVAGRHMAEIRVYDGSTVIGSANIVIMVEKSPSPENYTPSATELPLLEQASGSLATIFQSEKQTKLSESNAKASAGQAASSADAAGKSATASADSATKSADSATASAASAEAAAASEKNAMSATPDGYSKLAETFNALGLYVDSDGYPCQAINDEAQD